MTYKKTVVKEVERKSPPDKTTVSAGMSPEPGQMTIPVVEERLNIDKELVETGKIRIRKTVSEETVSESVPTFHENVTINRVEINKYVESAPGVRSEGTTTIIPVIREVLVVEKKLMLVEEIHIIRKREEVPVEIKDKVRKEHVEITKTDPADSGS